MNIYIKNLSSSEVARLGTNVELGSANLELLQLHLQLFRPMPRASHHAIPLLSVQRNSSIPYTCASCTLIRAIARVSLRQRVLHLRNQRRRQYASTFASPATVNKAVDIPESSRELYNALEGLKKDAAGFTNLSRVQLALKSLEERAGVRVAVLGLGGEGLAKRLVRLLLADPLAKQGDWERKVGGEADDDGTSLLLRYVSPACK
jgi:hypothetical protein